MQTTIQTKARLCAVKPPWTFTSFKACNFTNRTLNEVIKQLHNHSFYNQNKRKTHYFAIK
ncbi:hypothetical protein SAMN02745202_00677 [Segatella oulorum]|uniref:Uncharacterized protein n=1 Tax=Segatella oulorum TaxID=28136 RepID=A0A1T4MB16_9BACT|nr:hypothetical protein SAMN02745202_00677 [Segatella oulorum]